MMSICYLLMKIWLNRELFLNLTIKRMNTLILLGLTVVLSAFYI